MITVVDFDGKRHLHEEASSWEIEGGILSVRATSDQHGIATYAAGAWKQVFEGARMTPPSTTPS